MTAFVPYVSSGKTWYQCSACKQKGLSWGVTHAHSQNCRGAESQQGPSQSSEAQAGSASMDSQDEDAMSSSSLDGGSCPRSLTDRSEEMAISLTQRQSPPMGVRKVLHPTSHGQSRPSCCCGTWTMTSQTATQITAPSPATQAAKQRWAIFPSLIWYCHRDVWPQDVATMAAMMISTAVYLKGCA